MPTFTWTIPAPGAPPSSSAASSSVLTPEGVLFGAFDQEIDPATRDYVDTDDGAWAETASSRSAVMMQLEIRYNTWAADPDAGSRVPEMLESEAGASPLEVLDETRRAMQVLVEDGIIADLSVEAGTSDPDAGAMEIRISYSDVSTGHAVELVYSPL